MLTDDDMMYVGDWNGYKIYFHQDQIVEYPCINAEIPDTIYRTATFAIDMADKLEMPDFFKSVKEICELPLAKSIIENFNIDYVRIGYVNLQTFLEPELNLGTLDLGKYHE